MFDIESCPHDIKNIKKSKKVYFQTSIHTYYLMNIYTLISIWENVININNYSSFGISHKCLTFKPVIISRRRGFK